MKGACLSSLFAIVFLSLSMAPPCGVGAAQSAVRAQAAPTVRSLTGTLVVQGRLTSTATLTMSGAFSVGQARSLDWNLPLVSSIDTDGYAERADGQDFHFNLAPQSFRDSVDPEGRPVRRFHWDSPPRNTVITVSERLRLTVQSDLTPFSSDAPYPLSGSGVPRSTLAVTPQLQLSAAGRTLAHRLAAGKHSEQSVVQAVIDWVATHVHYAADSRNVSAKEVLLTRRTDCRGYSNLSAALLRYLGIPTQIEFGWVSSQPLRLLGSQAGWIRWGRAGSAGSLHVWLATYFPGSGWVPFDPQTEKFFIDPRHFAFWSSVDASDPHVGTWSAVHLASENPTGKLFSDGAVEILPGDGISSKVTVTTSDDVQATVLRIQHDVKRVLLFSRQVESGR